MIAEALKKALLQAAIQGKLTEQLPEDGDARDLIKEIQKEKARLIKEGKIKKEKPLPEIKEDEILFDIPENWAWCYLSFVTTSISPRPFQIFEKEILSEGLYPVVSQGKKLIEGYSNCQEKLLTHEKPIILFGDHTKNLKLIDFDFVVGADGTKLIQPIGILPDYLFRNLQYNVFSIGTRNYGRHFSLLNSVLIAVPPIEEQKRIIHKLDKLLPEIEVLEIEEYKLDNLEKAFPGKIRSSILQSAIQGKLTEQLSEDGDAKDLLKEIQKEKARLIKEGKIRKEKPLPEITEDEIPFEIPENWAWIRMGDVIQLVSGTSFAKNDTNEHEIRIIRGGNIDDPSNKLLLIDDDIHVSSRLYDKEKEPTIGDIIIVGSTGSKKVIGKPAFIDQIYENVQIGAFLRIIRPTFSFLRDFLKTVFRSEHYRQHIRDLAQGTNINNIKTSYLTEFIIPLPPLSEQKRIHEKLEELLPLCEQLE